jgi:hypothetical protein
MAAYQSIDAEWPLNGDGWTGAANRAIGNCMTAERIIIETIGWAGAVTILVAYLLLSAGRLGGQSRLYQWMNLVGAACFVVNSGYNGAIPSAVLNVIWAGIGLFTLWRIARRPA